MRDTILTLILVHFVLFSFSQGIAAASLDDSTQELPYEVNRVYAPLSIDKEQLKEACTIVDLHPHYKPSWIREFIFVEVLTSQEGKAKKAVGKDDTLTKEQKELLITADIGAEIAVNIRYIPENTLADNEPKTFDFKFLVNPEKEATYVGGMQALRHYLKEKAIDKISADSFENYDLSAIKFTINEKGEVIDAHVFADEYRKSNYEKTDALLLESIRAMPCWKPAEYANGRKVKQEFVLTVGNHQSCMINLVNVRRDIEDKE